jgi:hypothetical protein
MKVFGRTKGMLWRAAEWITVTLGFSWFVIWACTRGRSAVGKGPSKRLRGIRSSGG